MKRILLVAPAFEAGFRLIQEGMSAKKAFLAPLPIATIAALTPREYHIELWDEAVQGLIGEGTEFESTYDLVGITGYTTQIHRTNTIAREFRRRGVPIAIGGPGASVAPDLYVHLADFIFIGEAEFTWPQFLKDWENGSARRIYRQVLKPDLTDAPPPRWDLLKTDMSPYMLGAIQDSRGCPYDCHFCDVPFLFGHRMRSKAVSTICQEIEMLRGMGADGIFLCNDNFIGDLKYARNLLTELIKFNNTFARPVTFYTDLTLNVARYDDLLELFADANFGSLFIGIETPNQESLKEVHKVQNAYRDILQDVHKIQSYGMPVTPGIIVGFDNDTPGIFDDQFELIQSACLPMPRISMLCALHGTQLRAKLQREGRLLAGEETPHRPSSQSDFLAVDTNIIPLSMTRVELLQGYLRLLEQVRDWNNFAARIKGFVSGVRRKPNVKQVELPPDGLQRLSAFLLTLDDNTRNVVMDIVRHTSAVAPFMLPRVMRLVILNLREQHRLAIAKPFLVERIEAESAPGYSPEVAGSSTSSLDRDFVQIFDALMPEVYQKVKEGLRDKIRAEDITVGVFGEFLSNRRDGSPSGVEHARTELLALCASAVEAENSALPTASPIGAGPMDGVKSKLSEDIFNHIERDVRLRSSLLSDASEALVQLGP